MANTTIYQYLAIICANICTIGIGTSFSWTSSANLVLGSDDSPIETGPLTISQLAWVSSLIGVGGVAGTVIFGWMCDAFGRKPSLLFSAFPLGVSWILIMYARSSWYLYVARFLAGLASGGAYVTIPMLVGEIAEDKIRGALGSLISLFANLGVLIGFLAGHYLPYEALPKVLLVFPVIFIAMYIFFPESPWYLIKRNKFQEAENSLRFYRNISMNSSKKDLEWFGKEFNTFSESYMKKIGDDLDEATKITYKDFICRPLIICVGIIICHDFCGVFTMINYTGQIFAASGSELPPNQSAVIVGFIQFIGTYVSTLLVDRVGRKLLLSLSCIGTGLSHLVLGTYIYLSTSVGINLEFIQWVPVASFSSVLFIASCGLIPIPYVVLGEIMPDKVRGPATVTCLILGWGESFVLMKMFPPIMELCGLHGCIYLFAAVCLVALFYTIIFIPETKGKSLADIEKSFEINSH